MDQTTTLRVEQPISFGAKLGEEESQQQVRPPPCEMFAISRWADMGWHCRTNPAPLRSAFELWGRHDLTPREQRQVRTSNVLLIYAIAFVILPAIYGIANWTSGQGTGASQGTQGAAPHNRRLPTQSWDPGNYQPVQLGRAKNIWKRNCNSSPRHPGSSKSPRRGHQLCAKATSV